MKVGRNDPCPCGSGKKYKQCCLKSENTKLTPELNTETMVNNLLADAGVSNIDEFDEKMQEYQKFIEQNPAESNLPQSFMEHLGRPNRATNTIKNIHQMLDGHKFASEKERDFFLANYMSQQNNRAIEDFLGVSPAQMMRISQESSFEEIEDIVILNEELTNKDIASVPIIQYLEYLLSMYVENNYALELTAKGNYKPYLVEEFNAHFFADDKYLCKVNREDKSWALGMTHSILLDFEYIVDRSTKSYLDSEGLLLLEEDERVDLYLDILEYLLYDLDWMDQLQENFGLEELSDIQHFAIFSLFLLKNLAARFTAPKTIYAAYIKAFPDFDPSWGSKTPSSLIPILYNLLLTNFFCIPLGLVELEEREKTREKSPNEISFRTTKLFRKLFQWQIGKR